MKNLTTLHKKLGRVIEEMGTVDKTRSLVRQIAETNRYFARSIDIIPKITAETREEGQRVAQIQKDVALLTQEALKASRESAERTAQILAAIRTH